MYNKLYILILEGLSGASRAALKSHRKILKNSPKNWDGFLKTAGRFANQVKAIPRNKDREVSRSTNVPREDRVSKRLIKYFRNME